MNIVFTFGPSHLTRDFSKNKKEDSNNGWDTEIHFAKLETILVVTFT